MILKTLISLAAVALSLATTLPTPDLFPISTVPGGNIAVAIAPALGGETRFFYQREDGGIQMLGLNGSFATGSVYLNEPLVPPEEVQFRTPLITMVVDDMFTEIRLFFLSPQNVVSEYLYQPNHGGWRGGATCLDIEPADCLTNLNFVAAPGSSVLYAAYNPSQARPGAPPTAWIRVGFVSAGNPLGLTEAVFDINGWRLETMN
ncbi:hypothetical protein FB45DRAFT_1051119 [Roridomyces roridus]|uniref:Fucose-specific lectin n=1 Tax=Roridomyces roridus TaxID=1738132 RepID=A0AAD7CL91_9AGAR|nr:hypothetical protein FB45DRAFT_1051119 [Roridomyces roridus]